MKPLIKSALALIGFFLLIFAVLNLTGILTQEELAQMVRDAKSWPHWMIGLLVIALLTSDIIIPVPGIVVVSLSGYFLGAFWGAFCGSIGLTLAGAVGYWLCRVYGYRMLKRIYRDEEQLADMRESFHRHSTLVLLLSRAVPMFPEAASCLAGATKMPFWKYLITFGFSCTIYSIAVAYAGSLSSEENLKPALYAYLSIMAVLWTSWAVFIHKKKRAKKRELDQ